MSLDQTRYDSGMLSLLRDLFAHQAWADTAILKAIRAHPNALEDENLRKTLHHILIVQRFFLAMVASSGFDNDKEGQVPATLDDFELLFREAHEGLLDLVGRITDADLGRVLEIPMAPDLHPTVAEVLTQVAMHSMYHRGQCAARLRAVGGAPPLTDFILWAKQRRAAAPA